MRLKVTIGLKIIHHKYINGPRGPPLSFIYSLLFIIYYRYTCPSPPLLAKPVGGIRQHFLGMTQILSHRFNMCTASL
jgi:hypothetical protein